MTAEPNGRVKLSVRDIIAWLVLFAAIIGNWYDTRGQLALLRQELSIRVKIADDEHVRIWQAVRDVQASEKVKPRR